MQLKEVLDEITKAALGCGRDPNSIKLLAVSKGKAVEQIEMLYKFGQRDFGESKVQEANLKRMALPNNIHWHLIGSLQIKKVPKVVGQYTLIHSVDTLELAQKLSRVSQERNIVTDILLQVNASGEATKHGFSLIECKDLFSQLLQLPSIRILGLMTMAPLTDDKNQIRACFGQTADLCKTLQEEYKQPQFCELSMGMSQDFELAIEAGATIVRIGTKLFL